MVEEVVGEERDPYPSAEHDGEELGERAVEGVPVVAACLVDGDAPGVGVGPRCGDPEQVIAVVGHPDGEEGLGIVGDGEPALGAVLDESLAQGARHVAGEIDPGGVPMGVVDVDEATERARSVDGGQLLVVAGQAHAEGGLDGRPVHGRGFGGWGAEPDEGVEVGHVGALGGVAVAVRAAGAEDRTHGRVSVDGRGPRTGGAPNGERWNNHLRYGLERSMPSHLRKLGSSDLEVFPLALGGNVFGWTADEKRSFAVLDAYVAAGGNFVDTADSYSAWVEGNTGGESETIIGKWLTARGNRSDVVIATKVGQHPEYPGLSAANIKAAADASLRRLGTDHIDLYYTHFDKAEVPVEEIIGALDGLVKAGKVRAIAASNISPARLRESLDFSDREGLARYVALQPHYNLGSRDTYEGELQGVADRAGLAAVPYYALASGFLTGKYRPGAEVDSARAQGAARHLDTERGRKVLAALDEVAQAHDAQVATVALAWLAAQPTVVAPIASARTVEQLPALLGVAELTLTDADIARLTAASA